MRSLRSSVTDAIISAAIERLEAEKKARIQAKIDAGKAVRAQLPIERLEAEKTHPSQDRRRQGCPCAAPERRGRARSQA
jgi:hypothetical protein